MQELDDLLGLSAIAHKPTRQLSLGERMKCELAAALLHRPEILFLDEPTIGLDVSMQLAVRDFIRRVAERRGATLLLTSHYMDDVAALCPRVIVIDAGTVRYDGDLTELARRVRPEKRIAVRFTSHPGHDGHRALFERIGKLIELMPERAVIEVRKEELRNAMSALLENGSVTDLTVEDPPLEEVMRELFAASEPNGTSPEATDA
jgi:ABC-2 type transport system ATP-binding protein